MSNFLIVLEIPAFGQAEAERDAESIAEYAEANVVNVKPVMPKRGQGRYTHDYMEDRIEWLRETLIPDLRESGTDATADDFEMCASMIKQLLGEIEED